MNKHDPGAHFLSLIIPAYKQQDTIVKNVKNIKHALDRIRYDYEIIIVVDGTVDKTYTYLKKAHINKVVIISYKHNQGKSFAIRLGMKKSVGDYVMFLDAGGEIHPNGISMLLEHMEWYKADIICGSKRHPASQVRYSPLRRFLSVGYYFGVRVLFHLSIRDTQAGIKIFRKKVLEKILPRLVEKKFTGDLEMLVVARRLGYKRIYEAPIKLDYEFATVTSAASLRTIWGMVIDTMAIFYRTYFLKYYDKKHVPEISSKFTYKIFRP